MCEIKRKGETNSEASLEKLNGENCVTWSILIRSLLITLDLWDAFQGVCPTEPDKKAAWRIMDLRALAMVNLSVRPNELVHIKDCVTAKGMGFLK